LVAAGDVVYTKLKETALYRDTMSQLKAIIDARAKTEDDATEFRLSFSQATSVKNPSDSDLRNAVKLVGMMQEEFLILDRGSSRNEFMQSTTTDANKFIIEFRSFTEAKPL
jgi:hypothetical protein